MQEQIYCNVLKCLRLRTMHLKKTNLFKLSVVGIRWTLIFYKKQKHKKQKTTNNKQQQKRTSLLQENMSILVPWHLDIWFKLLVFIYYKTYWKTMQSIIKIYVPLKYNFIIQNLLFLCLLSLFIWRVSKLIKELSFKKNNNSENHPNKYLPLH